MPSPRVNFRAIPPLDAALTDRTDGDSEAAIAQTGRRDLERYYAALARALRSVRLTEHEAALVCDASNGTLWEETSASLLWAEIDDAIQLDHLDAKWGVDGPALVERLRALPAFSQLAIADATERYWRLVGAGDTRPMGEMMRSVGLVRS